MRFPAPRETEGREKAGVSLSIFIDTGRNLGNQFLESQGAGKRDTLNRGTIHCFGEKPKQMKYFVVPQ